MNAAQRSLKRFFLLVLLLLVAHIAGARTAQTITGTIRDTKGLPLPGVTVFISGTKIIAATGNDGSFSFSAIQPGSYVLIAKMIGFEAATLPVEVKDKTLRLVIILKETAHQLNTVVITADPNWEDHYMKFKRWFLGTTPAAARCTIINKKALHFHYDKNTRVLTATADELLQIENTALGYDISYLLQSFALDENTHIANYQGYPSFKDREARSEKETAAWANTRSMAYHGSITHFMRALFADRLYQEGFTAFSLLNKPPVGTPYDPEKPVIFDAAPVLFDSLLTVSDKDVKSLAYKNCLFVVYTKENEPFGFKDSGYQLTRPKGKIPRGQYSMINLMENSVDIDANGNFSPPNALLFEGFMAWQQVADLTPLEFLPPGPG